MVIAVAAGVGEVGADGLLFASAIVVIPAITTPA